MRKGDGSVASINLLRPLWWLEEANAQVGGTIFLSMPEMGIEGDAAVLEVGPCPVDGDSLEPGRQIVTGTFVHQNALVLDLYFGNHAERLSATANHPIWSESRNVWVEAGKLKIGEYVATKDGVAQLIRCSQRPGRHKVYNLEVHRTHNYYVSNLGILVHNSCQGRTTGDIKPHQSKRAARRAAEKDAGMGKHGGREQLPDKELRKGSRSPQGEPGARTEVKSADTGEVVHHDPYGTRYDDGDVTPPHYGVDKADGSSVHHTYPSDHDPTQNR
jgi:hypothetical protein